MILSELEWESAGDTWDRAKTRIDVNTNIYRCKREWSGGHTEVGRYLITRYKSNAHPNLDELEAQMWIFHYLGGNQ